MSHISVNNQSIYTFGIFTFYFILPQGFILASRQVQISFWQCSNRRDTVMIYFPTSKHLVFAYLPCVVKQNKRALIHHVLFWFVLSGMNQRLSNKQQTQRCLRYITFHHLCRWPPLDTSESGNECNSWHAHKINRVAMPRRYIRLPTIAITTLHSVLSNCWGMLHTYLFPWLAPLE